MNPSSVFIIIPTFNEEEVLYETVSGIVNSGYTIVVVDDGSFTHQCAILTHLPVRCLRHAINLGQGAALQTGTEYALEQGAEYIVHFDADGQHMVADISGLLVPLLSNKCDVVFGSRFLKSSETIVPYTKKILIHVACYVHSFFTGFLLTDAHNGLRAMNRKAASLLTITENRMGHASELLFLIRENRLRLQEVAVTVLYTKYSLRKGQSSWNSIRIGFDLFLHKLFS
jgi:polyprenyl-phospho-N-acetylgalactosaminyl synthase